MVEFNEDGSIKILENLKKQVFQDEFNSVINISWEEYVKLVKDEGIYAFTMRKNLLQEIENLFKKYRVFEMMDDDERRAIAGYYGEKEGLDWNFFGSMMGSGIFKNHIRENDPLISRALDCIPLTGKVTEEQFKGFVEEYDKIDFNGQNIFSPATRLLAMKRPDYFVCITSKSKDKLLQDFKLKEVRDFETYWNQIILKIQGFKWWNSPSPNDPDELMIWKGRVAFLDAIYRR